jgi:hypothetical protein
MQRGVDALRHRGVATLSCHELRLDEPDSRPNFDEPIPSKKQIERQKSDGCGQKCATRRAVRELERKADRRK